MNIFSTSIGRKIEYQPPRRRQGETGTLTISDTAPPTTLNWSVTRGVLIRIGVRAIIAAIKP